MMPAARIHWQALSSASQSVRYHALTLCHCKHCAINTAASGFQSPVSAPQASPRRQLGHRDGDEESKGGGEGEGGRTLKSP
eukprot:2044955-Rhodomonas_salina.1